MNPRLAPHRQKLRDREAEVPTGVESLTGSDPLLSQGDKKLAVRGLTICITVAFRAGSLATTSYQNRCFNQQDDSLDSCRFAEILIPKENASLGTHQCLLEACPTGLRC